MASNRKLTLTPPTEIRLGAVLTNFLAHETVVWRGADRASAGGQAAKRSPAGNRSAATDADPVPAPGVQA
jgi:hypothetical protein